MKAARSKAAKPAKPKVKPITITIEGELAEEIRKQTKGKGEKAAQDRALLWCELGFDPTPHRQRLFIEVDSDLALALERLAEAGDYTDGVRDLLLETTIPKDVILEAVSRSMIRIAELTRAQIHRIATTVLEEKLRHGTHHADPWAAEHTLGLEVEK